MHFHRRRNGAALIEAVAIIGWCSMATPTLAADVPSVSSTGQSMPVQDWPVMTGRGGGAECVPDEALVIIGFCAPHGLGF